MRCFFAIPLSDEAKDYLYDLMNSLKKELKNYNLKIRFTPKKNLHITLMFLGEIKEDKLEGIKEKVRGINFKPFKFELSKLGVFPNEDIVRVLWIGITPAKDAIALQKKIDESLLSVIENKDHEFKAHITLARVKYSKQSSKITLLVKKVNVKNIKNEINSFGLYRSELHKDGSKYFLLEGFEAKSK